MSLKVDLVGQTFGKLKVVEQVKGPRNGVICKCECECGAAVDIAAGKLIRGKRKSCGCAPSGPKTGTTNPRLGATGERYGKLTLLEYLGKGNWKCKCDCGNTHVTRIYNLKRGQGQHCGCSNGLIKDITGQKFGMLTVVRMKGYIEYKNSRVSAWECKCDCGTTIVLPRLILVKDGERKSCGCINVVDIKGKRFGKLEAVDWVQNKYGWTEWECTCDCGNKVMMPQHELERGLLNSCGCDDSWPELGHNRTMLYVLQVRDRVKIGITKSAKKRLGDIQTWSPLRVEVIRLFKDATKGKEASIHFSLAHLNTKGEWFQYTPELISLVRSASDIDDFVTSVRKRYSRLRNLDV